MKPVRGKVCYWGMVVMGHRAPGAGRTDRGAGDMVSGGRGGGPLGWGPTALPMEPPKKWW